MMVTYLLRVLPYLRPYWRLGIGSVWLTIGATLFGLLSPWPLKVLVDNVIGGAPLPPVIGGLLGGFEAEFLVEGPVGNRERRRGLAIEIRDAVGPDGSVALRRCEHQKQSGRAHRHGLHCIVDVSRHR